MIMFAFYDPEMSYTTRSVKLHFYVYTVHVQKRGSHHQIMVRNHQIMVRNLFKTKMSGGK